MKTNLISYETAKLLYEKTNFDFNSIQKESVFDIAPKLDSVIEWLWEQHKIFIEITIDTDSENQLFKYAILKMLNNTKNISERYFLTHYYSDIKYSSILELKDIAIRKAINLIKQIENDEQEKMNVRFNEWLRRENETWGPGDEYD